MISVGGHILVKMQSDYQALENERLCWGLSLFLLYPGNKDGHVLTLLKVSEQGITANNGMICLTEDI